MQSIGQQVEHEPYEHTVVSDTRGMAQQEGSTSQGTPASHSKHPPGQAKINLVGVRQHGRMLDVFYLPLILCLCQLHDRCLCMRALHGGEHLLEPDGTGFLSLAG